MKLTRANSITSKKQCPSNAMHEGKNWAVVLDGRPCCIYCTKATVDKMHAEVFQKKEDKSA